MRLRGGTTCSENKPLLRTALRAAADRQGAGRAGIVPRPPRGGPTSMASVAAGAPL